VAIGYIRYPGNEGNIQTAFANLKDGVAGTPVEQLKFNARRLLPVAMQKVRQEAGGNCRRHADADTAKFTAANHSGSLHRIVELVYSLGHMVEKEATSVG